MVADLRGQAAALLVPGPRGWLGIPAATIERVLATLLLVGLLPHHHAPAKPLAGSRDHDPLPTQFSANRGDNGCRARFRPRRRGILRRAT